MFGEFTLVSGKKSNYYFDSKKTTLLPEGAYLTATEILKTLRDNNIEADAIGGMTLGADPIVCPVAALSQLDGPPLRAFIVRKEAKEYGTCKLAEGADIDGRRVLVIEDVVTTGGSLKETADLAREDGCEVVAVAAIVDRSGDVKPDFGAPFHRLLQVQVTSWPPEDCPLCAKGLPAVKPGSRGL